VPFGFWFVCVIFRAHNWSVKPTPTARLTSALDN
jgi:hypothetical protein